MNNGNPKSKNLAEQEYSCSNYYSPESNYVSAKYSKFYLNGSSYVAERFILSVSFLQMF